MATALADAFVRIRPDAKGFAAEAQTQTSQAFGQVQKSTGSLTKSFGVLKTAVVGALAGSVVIDWGKKAVDAFLSAEHSQLQLQNAFDKFPALADTNIKSLEDLDAALGKKTVFDKYAIESGQAVLAQFHLTGTQIKELTPLLLDYAAKTGQDVPSAATALGKALLGNGRALKNIGVDFKNTGSATGNYSELVAALRGQVGGFAEQEGKSAEGQLKIMENRFHDLWAEVGGKLIPVISTAVGVILTVTSAIASSVSWLDKNRAAVFGVAAAIGVLLIPKMIELAAEFSSDAVQVFVKGLKLAQGAAAGASGSTLGMIATLGPLAVAAGVAGFVVVKSWTAQKKAIADGKKSADDYAASITQVHTSLEQMNGAVDLITNKYAGQVGVVQDLAKHGDIMTNNFYKQFAAMQEYAKQADAMTATTQKLNANEEALGKQYHLTRDQIEQIATGANIDLTQSTDIVTAAFWKQLTAVKATHHPLSQAQKDMNKVTDEALSATDQVNALKTAFDELAGKSLSADQASVTFANDLADLSAALKASKGHMDLSSQAGRDAREQFDKTAQASLDLASAQKDAGASNTTVKKTLDAAIKSLEKAAPDNAYVRSEVNKLKKAEQDLAGAIAASNAQLAKTPTSFRVSTTVVDPKTGYVTKHPGLQILDSGGWVDAPPGAPVPIIAHGGEFVVSREMLAGNATASSGPMVGEVSAVVAALGRVERVLLRYLPALPPDLAAALNRTADQARLTARTTVRR